MRIIVCGGRDYQDREAVWAALDKLHLKRGVTCLVQGHATGADQLAREWAEARGIPCQSYPADWRRFGNSAGPLRNQLMADAGADGVCAFPGGTGTQDMTERARDAGIPVWEPMKRRP